MGESEQAELDIYRDVEGPVDLGLYDLANGIDSAIIALEDVVELFMKELESGRSDREAITLALIVLTSLQEKISTAVERIFDFEDEI